MTTRSTDVDPLDGLSASSLARAPDLVRDLARQRLFGEGEVPVLGRRYRLLRLVGHGGMGDVYQATDLKLDRTVAIKVLSRDASADASAKARLVREALMMARVSNVHVVPVFDVGDLDDRVFVVMEYVDGPTLRAWLAEGPRPWARAIAVMLEAARGLAAAHAAGVVHRDFKPDNVMLDADGRTRVLDFGLASSVDAAAAAGLTGSASDEGQSPGPTDSLTKTGAVMGTPAYMAPELFDGEPATERSDQFAFCVTLHEALHGVRPFPSDSWHKQLQAARDGAIATSPRAREIPRWVRVAVHRGLSAKPEDRFETMDALVGALSPERRPTKRVWGLAAGAALLVAGTTAGTYGWQEYQRRSCGDAEQRLRGVWDPQQQLAVQSAMRETGLSYAETTWTSVHQRLDGYSTDWLSSHVDACVKTNVWHQQSEEMMDLRLRCLDDRLRSLGSLVEVLATADIDAVDNAVSAAHGLPRVEHCDDPQWLRQRVKPPNDPQTEAEVSVVRADLAYSRALKWTTRHAEALERAQRIYQRAEALEYPPLVAEALVLRGELELKSGKLDDAATTLREAFFEARRSEMQAVAAFAAADLVMVQAARAEYDDAVNWGDHARAESALLPDDRGVLGYLQSGLGQVHLRRGQFDEALAAHRLALAAFESLGGADDPNIAVAATNIGAVFEAQGEYDAATAELNRAADIFRRTLGADHPQTQKATQNLALIAFRTGRYADAVALLRTAIASQERVVGPDHVDLVQPLNTLGVILRKQGRYDDAMKHHERALAIAEQGLGPNHPSVGTVLNNMGTLLAWQERFDEALVHYRRDLAIARAAFGPDHPAVAGSLNNIGRALQQKGDLDGALDHYRRSLAIKEQTLGADHPNVASSLYNLGRILREQGRADEALQHLRRSLAIREQAQGPDHPEIADALVDIAGILADIGAPREAADAYRRAIDISAVTEASPGLRATAEFGLARALWTLGKRDEARARARAARSAYADIAEEDQSERIAAIDAWLARRTSSG